MTRSAYTSAFSLLVALTALAVITTPSRAADSDTIHLIGDNGAVELRGRPGSDLTLSGRLSVLSDQAAPELLWRPTDLKQNNGSEVIASSRIQVLSPEIALKDLKANTPRDINFKVVDLKVPGKYEGYIDLVLPGHGTTPAVHAAITLDVQEVPKITLRRGSDNIKLQLVNCSFVGCLLAKTMWPESLGQKFSFPLDNASVLPFEITNMAVAATGEVHHASSGDAITLDKPLVGDRSPILWAAIKVSSQDLVPDHYVGDIQMRIPGGDTTLKIPLELNVRAAPALPIVVLIFGILLGRFIKYMQEKGVPQSDLLRQLLQIRARAEQNPADLALLDGALRQARVDIDAMRLDGARADLTKLEARLTLLARLRDLETILSPRAAEAGVGPILTLIAKVRTEISVSVDPSGDATQIEQLVQALPPPQGPANPPARALEAAVATSVRRAAPTPPVAINALPRALRVVGLITGNVDAMRADVTLWFLRPLAWLVLVLLLTTVGFVQLYVKNLTFGADLVTDYFGLLVWATGSDVASRTLSNFKGT